MSGVEGLRGEAAEALAEALRPPGPDTEPGLTFRRVIAQRVLASDWLAAYVAARVAEALADARGAEGYRPADLVELHAEAWIVPGGWDRSVFIPHTGGPTYRLLFYPEGDIRFEHRCDRGERGTVICAPALLPEHVVTEADRKVSVKPSILCPDCGTHGFITDGRWVA